MVPLRDSPEVPRPRDAQVSETETHRLPSLDEGGSIDGGDRLARARPGESIPGEFFSARERAAGDWVTRSDALGRTTSIEGWLVAGAPKRDAAERKAQQELRSELPDDGRRYDASHLIAVAFGGRGEENLVLAPELVNRSYMRAIELALGAASRSAVEESSRLYVRCRVEWEEGRTVLPRAVCYEAFRETDAGFVKTFHAEQKVDWHPRHAMGAVLDDAGDLAGGLGPSAWAAPRVPRLPFQ